MCMMCEGATLEEVMAHVGRSIRGRGWVMQHVGDGEEGMAPWAYTIGLAEAPPDHAELVVANLGPADSYAVLAPLADAVVAGRRFEPGAGAVADGSNVFFRPVHPDRLARGLLANWFRYYGSSPPPHPSLRSLQVVLPDELLCPAHPQPRFDLPGPVGHGAGLNRAARRTNAHRRRPRRRPGPGALP